MSSIESFRPYPKFDEQEVYGLTGRPEKVLQLQPSNFEGPVATWANDRMRIFSETIVPKEVYIEQQPYKKEHRVAWIYHEGISPISGEPFAVHHVACDCSGDVDHAQSFEEQQAIVSSCPALMPVIERHADLIDAAYHTSEILKGLNYIRGVPLREQGIAAQGFVADSIVRFLQRDYTQPEVWMANIESGWTHPSLMAKIFKLSSEDIEWSVGLLAQRGEVETDGIIFGLSQRQKEILEMEKQFRLDNILAA